MACALWMLLLGNTPSWAQDSQYWTQKYGTKGLLLSGVAIAGGVDLSTTYYNPGGLAPLGDSMKVIAVKAFDFSNVTVDRATETGEDISEPRNSVLPSFFGGTVNVRLAGSSPLAYSLFPRQLATFNMGLRNIRSLDLLPQNPGPEAVVDEARFEEDLDETWAGVTWSRMLSRRVSVGLSQYVAVRSQRARRQILAQALANDSIGGSAIDVRGFSYNDWRAVTKIGISFEFPNARAGLVVTSPGIHIMGSADVGWNRFREGFDVDADPGIDNQLIASFQEDVPSDFHSPPSIGAGLAVDLDRTTIHLSAEAFGEEKRYSIFEMSPARDLGTSLTVPFEFFDERQSLVNFGAGVERQIGARTSAFVSVSSDFTATPDGESDIAFGDWDSYLVTGGLNFPVGKSEFTLGLGYGFGTGDADRIGRLNDSPLFGTAVDTDFEEAETRYRNFRLIVGFTI
ncbi:MAG TPA: hypothetical protein VFP58_15415 [Candidatus Eisenbacteria bacterium]|nr:hypothetical protein [Candidatus Eisenbacteria bacterium]